MAIHLGNPGLVKAVARPYSSRTAGGTLPDGFPGYGPLRDFWQGESTRYRGMANSATMLRPALGTVNQICLS